MEISVSISDETIKATNISNENTVCRKISNFTFSFLLSFTIDLYNLNPLTANANIAGINMIFCRNILINTNSIPFPIPIIVTQADIVYPKQNPLYTTIPNTTGIPNYCSSKKPNYSCKNCILHYASM